MGTWILRTVLILLSIVFAALVWPISLQPLDLRGLGAGLAAAALIMALEYLLRALELDALLGGLAGLLIGGAAAGLVSALLPLEGFTSLPSFAIKGFVFLLFGYTGMAIGSMRGDRFSLASLRSTSLQGTFGPRFLIICGLKPRLMRICGQKKRPQTALLQEMEAAAARVEWSAI